MGKKVRKLNGICDDCAKQLYPTKIWKSDKLNGITVCLAKCDICRIQRVNTPVRDFIYALGEGDWD